MCIICSCITDDSKDVACATDFLNEFSLAALQWRIVISVNNGGKGHQKMNEKPYYYQ